MAKLIRVECNSINNVVQSPSVSEWIGVDKIDKLRINGANGAAFRYTASDADKGVEYRTDTAASAIAALANA